ncbi:hypothetical protein [Cupriavidus sp. DF5525]|uniref:hypothetical protein n=1 Tax=Cupriavidus sp. DF5525 TaxID=3160989 RepID=UPI0035A8F5C7
MSGTNVSLGRHRRQGDRQFIADRLIPMGVWCDPVRNQPRENGCDTAPAGSRDRITEGISPDCHEDENNHHHGNLAMGRICTLTSAG